MPHRAAPWLCLLLALGCGRPEFDQPPNVVLITVDTLRADRLGAYGYPDARTPAIDRLAREGVVFEHAGTVIPRTSQSIATLFSSLYPHQHGSLEVGSAPRDDVPLAAEMFRAAGYATAGISANGAASRTQKLERGFDHFVDWKDLRRRHKLWTDQGRGQSGRRGQAEAVTREALDWIGRERDEPYFLWLLYFDPHWFYNPPPPWRDVVDWQEFRFYKELRSFQPKNATIYFNLNGRAAELAPEIHELYDAEISFTDAMLAPLFDALRDAKDERPTVIVLTADHGESLGEHDYYYEHGDFVWETTMAVPLIVHAPGVVPAGRRVRAPTSTLDVLPTLFGLIGLAPA